MSNNRPPSALMVVGRKYYKLHEMVWEYKDMGISKRIPTSSIPEGLVPDESKLFVAHPDAIIKVTADGKGLMELALELMAEDLLTPGEVEEITEMELDFWPDQELKAEDYVPAAMLTLAMAYSQSERKAALSKQYKIETCMGVIGYAYLDRIEYVVKDGEEGLPDDLKHLEGTVTPVSYEYEDDETGARRPNDTHNR